MAKVQTKSRSQETKTKDPSRSQGEFMFVELGYNAKTIAETLGKTEQTIGRWRTQDNWDRSRDEVLGSPHKIRQILLKEMRHIADGGEPRIKTDALSKVNRVFEGFNNKLSPGMVIMVMMAYDNFLAESQPELANKNIEPNKKFIQHIINLHG